MTLFKGMGVCGRETEFTNMDASLDVSVVCLARADLASLSWLSENGCQGLSNL